MSEFITCLQPGCSAPAETVKQLRLEGVAYERGREDGYPIAVYYDKRMCAAGHIYMVEVFEEELEADT